LSIIFVQIKTIKIKIGEAHGFSGRYIILNIINTEINEYNKKLERILFINKTRFFSENSHLTMQDLNCEPQLSGLYLSDATLSMLFPDSTVLLFFSLLLQFCFSFNSAPIIAPESNHAVLYYHNSFLLLSLLLHFLQLRSIFAP